MMEMKRWNREEIQKAKLLLSVHGSLPVQMSVFHCCWRKSWGAEGWGPASRLPRMVSSAPPQALEDIESGFCIFKVACRLLVKFPSLFWGMARVEYIEQDTGSVGMPSGSSHLPGVLIFQAGKWALAELLSGVIPEVWNPQPPSVSSPIIHLFPVKTSTFWSQHSTFGPPSGSRQPRGAV